MKRFKSLLLPMFIVGLLVLSGCVTPIPTSGSTSNLTLGPSFQPVQNIPADKAVVYIYRHYSSFSERGAPFNVEVNGKVVTTLIKDVYYPYLTEPGTIEFTGRFTGWGAPKSTCSTTLDAKAGRIYYLKGSVPKGFSITPNLVLVSTEVGATEIVNCKLISENNSLNSVQQPTASSTSFVVVSETATQPNNISTQPNNTFIGQIWTIKEPGSLRGVISWAIIVNSDINAKHFSTAKTMFFSVTDGTVITDIDGKPLTGIPASLKQHKKVEIKYSDDNPINHANSIRYFE